MERLVDYDKFIKDYGVLSNHEDDYRLLCAAKITAYTKDEVIAMFEEIQTEIKKHTMTCGVTNQGTWNECIACCSGVIQQKIDGL